MGRVIHGRVLVAGEGGGEALVGHEPLSFWGGYDQFSGEIIDRRHSLAGAMAAGRILAVPFTKGSSTTTAVLLEAVRQGNAPAAVITIGADTFLALASIVADEMYGRPFPVIGLTAEDFASLKTGERLVISRDGSIEILDPD
jgi:predicted aconitase with swiveling domain